MLKLTAIITLGNDAEVKEYNGQDVISFSGAHNESWKDANGQKQQRTTWIKCSKWCEHGKTGIAEYLKKGVPVYVEGMPSAHGYIDKEGKVTANLELRVDKIELLPHSEKKEYAPAGPPPANYATVTAKGPGFAPDKPEDDLPF